MSKDNNEFNPFDPMGVLKNARTSSMDAWSKMMIDLVNTEAYSQATAVMLDTWLTSSTPFRKALESAMSQALSNLKLPALADITSLAERLTNIEMRLDDLEAMLDERPHVTKARTSGSANGGSIS